MLDENVSPEADQPDSRALCPPPPSSASRLREFMNQADVLGLAKFVSIGPVQLQARFASAKLPPWA
eukprot:974953-Pelagomonas_calceolata.AAC.1